MLFSETVRLDPTRRTERELRLLGDRVSRLWNGANYLCRQAFLAKEGVPVGAELERRTKASPEYRQLPSDVAQETLKKLSEAWRAYFRLRRKWTADPAKSQKPGLPAYRKDRKTGERPFDLIPVKHPRSYALDPKDAHLALPRDRRRKPKDRLHVAYRGRRRHSGKRGRAEVAYDRARRRWYFSWSAETADPRPVGGERVAAVDLGVRIGASLSIEGLSQALHFEGREALRDWDFPGREIAKEQQAIAGTRGKVREDRAPSSRNIAKLHRKRRLRVEHALKCLAKEIAEVCAGHGVGTVHLGWPKRILRDVSYGDSLWAGRIHGFWSFAKALRVLEQALVMAGIKAVRVGERGSSSTCPCCGSREVVRHPRWLLRCKGLRRAHPRGPGGVAEHPQTEQTQRRLGRAGGQPADRDPAVGPPPLGATRSRRSLRESGTARRGRRAGVPPGGTRRLREPPPFRAGRRSVTCRRSWSRGPSRTSPGTGA